MAAFEAAAQNSKAIDPSIEIETAPTCVVCHCQPARPSDFLHCLCGNPSHVVCYGECADNWITSKLGLGSVHTPIPPSGWSDSIPGCPLCDGTPKLDAAALATVIAPALSPEALRRLFSAAAHSGPSNPPPPPSPSLASKISHALPFGILNLLEDGGGPQFISCPSCGCPFDVSDSDRACDAAWCPSQACRRAFCAWCLTDCSGHPKTDPNARADAIKVGDAHGHVKGNDCGLTGGQLYSGDAVADHHRRLQLRAFSKLTRRLSDAEKDEACALLHISRAQMQTLHGKMRTSHAKKLSTAVAARPRTAPPPSGYDPQFLFAANDGDAELVAEMISQNSDVVDLANWALPHNNALHYAARNGDANVVRLLLDAGADPMIADSTNMTPLHHLTNCNGTDNVETARLIVCAALRRNRFGELDEADLLYSPWNAKMNGGDTPLKFAGRHGHLRVKRYLECMEGASLGTGSVLNLASRGDALACAQVLRGEYKGDKALIRDWMHGTPALHFACKSNDLSTVRLFIQNGVDVFALEPHKQRSALHYLAIEANPNPEIAEVLLGACQTDAKRRRLLGAQDVDGKTALDYARGKAPLAAFLAWKGGERRSM